jgi:hypothetical protein
MSEFEFARIAWDNEKKQDSWVFWRNMQKMKNLYQADCSMATYTVYDFSKWLEVNFGIKIYFDKHGNVLQDYSIVDEAKYMFYLLKHT